VAVYVALLRGINVGGKNLIKMPALKECFELGGFEDVTTYIQSGNVLFRATGSTSALANRIEKMLTKTFDYQATAVVRSRTQMRSTVEKAPRGFGAEPKRYLCDVAFLKEPLTASSALKEVPLREEVDEAWAGRGALYLRRLSSRATQSRINRIASLPIYKNMTLRSWSTTTRLLAMMNGSSN
jgi:uncharacterized protein (DUF1697 family)